MAKINYDGVLEAAHFGSDGQLVWVRVYERKGAIFSDRILLDREEFIKQLKAGMRYIVGERILYMGSRFNVSQTVHLVERDGRQVIVTGASQSATKEIEGVPVI